MNNFKNSNSSKMDYGLETFETSMSWWRHWLTLLTSFTLILESSSKETSGSIFAYLLLAAGVVLLLFSILRLRSVFVRVTDKGVIFSTAFLAPNKLFVRFADIKRVYIKQTFFGKIFNYATLFIETNEKAYKVKCIEAPKLALKEINSNFPKSKAAQSIDAATAISSP